MIEIRQENFVLKQVFLKKVHYFSILVSNVKYLLVI